MGRFKLDDERINKKMIAKKARLAKMIKQKIDVKEKENAAT